MNHIRANMLRPDGLYDIAVDPNDASVVGVGNFEGTMTFPNGATLTSASPDFIGDDLVVWKISSAGQ